MGPGLLQNISAPFICEVPPFKATLTEALKKADFLFGNETEAAAYAKAEGWDTSNVAEIAKKISTMDGLQKGLSVVRNSLLHACAFRCRMMYDVGSSHAVLRLQILALSLTRCEVCQNLQVITQGKEPTIVAKGGKVTTYDVPPVDPSDIVDTNGAGDAFVGGFLAAFIKGKDTAECCKAGNFAASTIIKTSGTSVPSECSYTL